MLLRPLVSTLCLTPLLLASALLAQTPPTPAADQPAFTLHANTRLVLTDVTVTDHDGNPLRNLRKSAFHVFDGNAPQDIASLEEHTSTALAETPAPAPPQPRGTYNNDFILHPPPVLDIVLLDVTNLELEDQMYLSYQLTKFLNALPAGQQLAIYERYGANTVLLQNFTSDRKLLLDAAHRGLPRIPPTGREYLNDLDTLQQLGLYLSGLPGRKNILWFSGGSTLYLNQDPTSTPMEDQALIRRIYDSLEANRIAIYPIDARGLTANSGSAMINQHFRMNEVAEATGGHAFYNNNGLQQMAAHITSSGGDFYTLTYSPSNYKEDKKWHKVRVSLDTPGYSLGYRHGYFADGVNTTPQAAPKTLRTLLAGGASEGTSNSSGRSGPIVFQARVLPSTDPEAHPAPHVSGPKPKSVHGGIPYSIQYTVPAPDLSLSSVDGHASFKVILAAFVFNQYGTVVDRRVQRFTVSVNLAQLQEHPSVGVPLDQQLLLTSGPLYLLLAVVDESSGRSGNVQIALDVPSRPKSQK